MSENPVKFKEFLENYLVLLEELSGKKELLAEEKHVAQLRTAERSFNFLLDRFPTEKVKEAFGMEDWKALKQRRDKLASRVVEMIESDPKMKKRYEGYCEALKDPRKLSSLL